MTEEPSHKKEEDLASEVLEHLKNPPVDVINPNKDSKSGSKKYLVIFLILILLAAGGFAAWKFLVNDKNPPEQQPASAVASTENTSGEDTLSEPTQEYTSDRLLIDFKYPTGWKVVEDSGEIAITSPKTEIEDFAGENVEAEFKILIKQGADQSDSEYLGRGFAIKKSTPVKYSDPAAGQRKKSFVTDFGLDSSDNFAFFVLQGNFELEKDETLGPDFAKESDAILISGGFYGKDSEDKTGLTYLDPEAYLANETYLTAVETVKTLQLR